MSNRTLAMFWWAEIPIICLLIGIACQSTPASAGAMWKCPKGEIATQGSCVDPFKPEDQGCQPQAGDPVDVISGRVHEEVVDWSSGGAQPLELRRQYSSSPYPLAAPAYSMVGRAWRTNFDGRASWYLGPTPEQSDWVAIILPNNFEYGFNKQNGVWRNVADPRGSVTARTDMDVSLTVFRGVLNLGMPDGTHYLFDTLGRLSEIRRLGGYTQKITFTNDLVSRVSDNLGRWMEFDFTQVPTGSKLVSQVRTFDGKRISYAYQNRFPSLYQGAPVDYWALTTVTYPDDTASNTDNPKVSYSYVDDATRPGLLLASVTDERGVRVSRWTYDGKGRALSSEAAAGTERWQFAYDDGAGTVTTVNPLGKSTVYTYRRTVGPLRQLMSINGVASSNCVASNTSYDYDANGFRIRATDAEGRVTTWTRNSRGLPLVVTEAAGTTLQRQRLFTWDDTRPLVTSIAEPGLTTSYGYDALGRILSMTERDTSVAAVAGSDRTTSFTYGTSAALGPVSVDGPLPGPSDTVTYAYDALGNLSAVTNELGQVTRVTKVNATGQPLSLVDPNGVTTALTYDARGRITSVTVNPGAAQARTVFTYDAAGQITRINAPDGVKLDYAWNDARQLTTITNASSEKISYAYNANGDATSRTVRSADGTILRQQTRVFDELGRVIQSVGAAGQKTNVRYDRTDNLTLVQDPRGGQVTYGFDALQRIATVTDQANAQVSLTRDGRDGLVAYRDPRGVTTSYIRNGFGEIVQESGPDVGTTTIQRDARGLPVSITDARGVTAALNFDAAGRLTGESYAADPTQNVTYLYDDVTGGNKGVGRLTTILDGSGATYRSYDALGRVVSERRSIGARSYVINYGYNAAGRLVSILYPSGRLVSYTRNAAGQINGVSTKASASATASQTVAGSIRWMPFSNQLKSLSFGNGLAVSLSYDGDGRITGQRVANGAASVLSLGYSYGDSLNLTAIRDNVTAASSQTFNYDAVQRLAGATGPWGSLAWTYTANGDRLTENLRPPSGAGLIQSLAYPATSNRLASVSVSGSLTRSFAYDAVGNLTSENQALFRQDLAYDLRGRLASITQSGSGAQTTRLQYNALNQMVASSASTAGGGAVQRHYIYALDGTLLSEVDAATGTSLTDYIWLPADNAVADGEQGAGAPPMPLALVAGANTATPALLMIHTDHLRRPIRVTDATRATVWQAVFRPFGEIFSQSGTLDPKLRFPGQYALAGASLLYNWNRFYDPSLGRYAQPDPLRFVDGPSVYAYAGGSPLMRVDPEGRQSIVLPMPPPPPFFHAPSKPYVPGIPGWPYPIHPPHSRTGGGGSGGDNRCKELKLQCIELCDMALDNCALPDLQSMNFHRCVNQCLFDQNCPGNDYPDGWDNGKLGTPRPWQN